LWNGISRRSKRKSVEQDIFWKIVAICQASVDIAARSDKHFPVYRELDLCANECGWSSSRLFKINNPIG